MLTHFEVSSDTAVETIMKISINFTLHQIIATFINSLEIFILWNTKQMIV